ncbi:M48 family metallopeptidase [Olsenella uli]|uniref:M48 family metallopeptidase n=1 Tax=Olsenella uli TaxID=133926 RepID=UPI00325F9FAF
MAAKPDARPIVVDGLCVEVTRKRVRRVNLRVRPDGTVAVSAPPRVPLSQIERFVRLKRPWIDSAVEARLRDRGAEAAKWREGHALPFFSDAVTLHMEEGASVLDKVLVRLSDDGCTLYVTVAAGLSPDERSREARRLVRRWQADRVREAAGPLLERHEDIMGVAHSALCVRHMRTRWGSCNVRSRKITLNAQLCELPPICLESVVVHELCHLLEPSHNARFHALMAHYFPDWRQARRLMGSHPPTG